MEVRKENEFVKCEGEKAVWVIGVVGICLDVD